MPAPATFGTVPRERVPRTLEQRTIAVRVHGRLRGVAVVHVAERAEHGRLGVIGVGARTDVRALDRVGRAREQRDVQRIDGEVDLVGSPV